LHNSRGKDGVHKSIPWKKGRGASAGNQNAKKGIALPEWLRLESVESILMFIRQVLIPCTLSGKIGTRQSSAITTACKVLLDYDADLRDLEEIKRFNAYTLGLSTHELV
jgi:hypothetical protein